MIISDINHLEVEKTAEISGGTTILVETFSDALAAASATADGLITTTSTVTVTSAGNLNSSSVSISNSSAGSLFGFSLKKNPF